MKVNIPFIGEVSIREKEAVIQTVSVPKKKDILLGTFLDMGNKSLSDEKRISSKLMQAFYEWVFINITTLAEEVSKLEPELYKIVLKGGKYELVEIETHPILDLLDRFNETTTQSDAFYLTESHLDLAGDAFWYLEGGDTNNIKNIYLLQPDKVELVLGNIYAGATRMVEAYKYKTLVDGKSVEVAYKPEEILHIKVPNPNNPYRGHSVVEGIATSVDIDSATLEATRKFYENGMMAQFMLTTDNKLTQDQLKKLKAEMRAAYGGAKNFWKVPVFGGGIKPQTVQMSAKDAEMLPQQMWLRDKIMAAFKNTKASLGIVEDVNRANSESSLLNWKQSTIKPKMCRIIDSLNEFLVPRYGDNLVLGFKDPVPEDMTRKVTDATQLFGAGIITQDEAREMVDFDAAEESDETYSEDNVPKGLKAVNLKRVFRRKTLVQKKLDWQAAYEAAKPVARNMMKKEVIEIKSFKITTEDKLAYRDTKTVFIDRAEEQIKQKMNQYFEGFIERVTDNVENNLPEKKIAEKDLFDKEFELNQIKEHLMPVFLKIAASSSLDALKLISYTKSYMEDNYSYVSAQVNKFANSLLETDRDKLTNIISQGISDGNGPNVISRNIRNEMPDFTKNQANTISRTEALRTANHSSIEAWKDSGVVVQKEWLCDSNPCDYCAPLNGTKIGLEEPFIEDGHDWLGDAKTAMKIDYGDVEGGNLHPNCECTIVPILLGQESGPGAVDTPVGKVWHAEGYDPGQPLLGNAFYVARSKAGAAPFGEDISSFNLKLPEVRVLKIVNTEHFDDLWKGAFKKYPKMSEVERFPKYIKSLGYDAAEVLPTFDPLGGIAIYNLKYVPAELIKSLEVKELEAKIDKRTKKYRDLKQKSLKQEEYINELEKIVGIE